MGLDANGRAALRDVEFLFFDLDGTLFDHRSAERRAIVALAGEIGVEEETFAAHYTEVNAACWEDLEAGRTNIAAVRRRRMEEPLRRLGREEPLEEILRLGDRYLEIYLAEDHPLPGLAVCKRLAARYGVGILTNGFPETQWRKLEGIGLRELFRPVICSGDVGKMKPHREIFDYAAEAVGLAPERIALIGDNPSADIAGASAAGWRTVWLRPPHVGAERVAPEADATIDHLEELEGLFGG